TTMVRVRGSARLLSLVALLAGASWPIAALAQKTGTAAPQAILFGINEGATTQVSVSELETRYDPLAKYIAKVLGKSVRVVSHVDQNLFQQDFFGGRYAIVFGKSVN